MIQWLSFGLCVPLSTTHHEVSRVGSDYCCDHHDDYDYNEYDDDDDDDDDGDG